MSVFSKWVLAVVVSLTLSYSVRSQTPTVLEDFRDVRALSRASPTGDAPGFLVIDPDKKLSIHHDALRLPPPTVSEWGRMGFSHGPHDAEPGLSMAARIRIGDCLRWDQDARKFAAGWFADSNPMDPTTMGHAMILSKHTDEARCALKMSHSAGPTVVLTDLMQLDFKIIGMIRRGTVMYYLSSAEGVPGIAAYPHMRPIAVQPVSDELLYAGLHQRNERDDRHPTRLESIQVDLLSGYATWYGTAHAADDLLGSGEDLVENAPAVGDERWRVAEGQLRRTQSGAAGSSPGAASRAVVQAPHPSGLVRAVFETSGEPRGVGLYFREVDAANYWYLALSDRGVRLLKREGGEWSFAVRSDSVSLEPGSTYDVWVQDDGDFIQCYVNGRLVVSARDKGLAGGTSVGIGFEAGSTETAQYFEAHPREIEIPSSLRLGAPYQRKAADILAADDFQPPAGELAERTLKIGDVAWEKGYPSPRRIEVQEDGGARVSSENFDYMAYTVPYDWDRHGFIDVSSDMIPPDPPNQGHVGIVLLQDPQNFLMLGWDTPSRHYGLWCTINDEWIPVDLIHPDIPPGSPFNVRATFDGDNYILYMNDEPIIIAKISDTFPEFTGLKVRRVGIGLTMAGATGDQGTIYKNFIVRR